MLSISSTKLSLIWTRVEQIPRVYVGFIWKFAIKFRQKVAYNLIYKGVEMHLMKSMEKQHCESR